MDDKYDFQSKLNIMYHSQQLCMIFVESTSIEKL